MTEAQVRTSTIKINDIEVEIIRKFVRNLRLVVTPPNGKVTLTLPFFVSESRGRDFVVSKLRWIMKQQARFKNLGEPNQTQNDKEALRYLGNWYALALHEGATKTSIEQTREGFVDIYLKPGKPIEGIASLIETWYRRELKQLIPPLLTKWEAIIGVKALDWGVKRMKTRWGTCNVRDKRIWLNLELIKQPMYCIEYVLLHELVHLLEPSHNARFKSLMTQFMPNWKKYEKELQFGAPHAGRDPRLSPHQPGS